MLRAYWVAVGIVSVAVGAATNTSALAVVAGIISLAGVTAGDRWQPAAFAA